MKYSKLTSFLVLISILSCWSEERIEKLDVIPEDFQGIWIDELQEFKKEVSHNEIKRYDLTITEE